MLTATGEEKISIALPTAPVSAAIAMLTAPVATSPSVTASASGIPLLLLFIPSTLRIDNRCYRFSLT